MHDHPRRRLLFLAGIVMALVAGACAGAGQEDPTGTTLAVMVPPSERPFWIPIADAFEDAHPGVRVDLVEGPQSTDLRENLYTTSLLARDPTFDLVYMDVTWTAKFAAAGWLRPLDSSLPDEEKRALLPVALAAGMYQGALYRVPIRTDVGLLYYRRDLLERAGLEPPRDFAELSARARALQDPPARWGFVWQGRQYEGLICAYLEVLHGHGGFWVDPLTLEVGLDHPEAEAALTFLVDCVRGDPISPPGVTTYQEEESRRLFQDGRAVFLRNWPYAWRLAQSEESPIRGRIGVMPMVHTPSGAPAGTLGGWGLGISAFSDAPQLAMAFILASISLDAQRMLCAPTGYAPARLEAYGDSSLRAVNPFLSELRTLQENAVARPVIARYALASDILQRHLSAALGNSANPASALQAAASETRAMLHSTAGDAAAAGDGR
jgi:multiple sugar transport system substrate-binding protein